MRSITTIIFMLAFCVLNGQNAMIDSLQNRIGSLKNDTSKVQSLNKLAFEYRTVDPAKTISYGQEALRIAEDLNYKKGQADAFRVISIGNIISGDNEKAKDLAISAIQISRDIDYKTNLASMENIVGIIFQNRGLYDSALTHFQKAAKTHTLLDNSVARAGVISNIGLIYQEKGEDVKALQSFQESLQIYEEVNNLIGIVSLLNNIGVIYQQQKNYEKALHNYKKALAMEKPQNRPINEAKLNGNIGEVYLSLSAYDSALYYLNNALKIYGAVGAKCEIARVYWALGITTLELNELIKSEEFLNAALQTADACSDRQVMVKASLGLGSVMMKLDEGDQAMIYYSKAFLDAKSVGLKSELSEAALALYKIYKRQSSYQKALSYHEIFQMTSDSLINEENIKNLTLMEAQYEFEKESALARIQAEKEKIALEASIQQEKSFRNIAMLTSGLLMIIVLLTGYAFKIKHDSNKQLKAQNVKIATQANELESLNKMKSKFFTSISHEFKTPLTLILGLTKQLQKNVIKNETYKKLAIVDDNANKLFKLIDELLDLSKLESDKISLAMENLHILPLLDRLLSSFESLTQSKSIKLKFEFLEDADKAIVSIDTPRFEKIINNLVFNAIKFTEENGEINVSGKLSENRKDFLIEITDNGTGISEEDLPYVFDRFYQASHNQYHKDQGTGIGLSLSRELTELHGGAISVESTLGVGTTFKLSFPIVEIKEAEEITSVDIKSEEESFELKFNNLAGKERPTALIVEDHDLMRDYIGSVLSENFEITNAENGKVALGILKDQKVDLVITDLMMPEMDGGQFIEMVKSNDKISTIPLIVLSAKTEEQEKLNLLRLGIDDYIYKPFSESELKVRAFNLIQNFINRKRKEFTAYVPEVSEDPGEEFLNKLKIYVENKIGDFNISVSALADHVAMSERQLYRKLGSLTGLTPANLIKEVKLNKAMEYLRTKKINKVSEVASMVGYDSPSYFSRQFQQRFGTRPSDYISKF
ncbi:MAG TPA: tetratricopeptide repeat protein [Cyclobacteriaceae bacterium]